MKILREHIIVKVPSVFIDETRYKGLNGKAIVMNVFHNPEQHIRCHGIVASVPNELPMVPIAQNYLGAPGYHETINRPSPFKYCDTIRMEIEEGDKVYFHYNCLLPAIAGGPLYNQYYLYTRKEMFRGKEVDFMYFRVKYELVYAAIRYEGINKITEPWKWDFEADLTEFTPGDKPCFIVDNDPSRVYYRKVVMIGSHVFVEPDKETWEDISIPIPEMLNGVPMLDTNGQIKMKPKEQWLVTKSAPEEQYLRGWVRHAGSALIDDKNELEVGMYVYFRPYADARIVFEGKEYFRMRQRNVLAWEPGKSTLKQLEYA